MSGVTSVADFYRNTFGLNPVRVFSAPGRINLIGEHTDYNGGLALPVAISERTWVAIGPNRRRDIHVASDFSSRTWSMNLDSEAKPKQLDWALYPLGVAWLMHHRFTLPQGFNLAISSSVPMGAGLSSSAALESATALSLASFLDADISPLELALIGQETENSIVGAPTGLMDQLTTIFSREAFATLIDFTSLAITHHPLDLNSAEMSLLVIDTGVKHSHASGGYGDRRRECDEAREILGVTHLSETNEERIADLSSRLGPTLTARALHIVTENQRVRDTVDALDRGALEALGALFRTSHGSLKDGFAVSCEELDLAVDTAYESGAIAARMTGGGFGGSALALVPSHLIEQVRSGIQRAFSQGGLAQPTIFTTSISDGARRDH